MEAPPVHTPPSHSRGISQTRTGSASPTGFRPFRDCQLFLEQRPSSFARLDPVGSGLCPLAVPTLPPLPKSPGLAGDLVWKHVLFTSASAARWSPGTGTCLMRLLPGPAPGLTLTVKSMGWGTSLMVQWLLFHASTAEAPSSVRKSKYRKPHSMTKENK